MKFTAKQMGRLAKKAHSSMEAEKKKCKQAIEQSNVEGAKIHAENAVRNEKQEISYLRYGRLSTCFGFSSLGMN